MAEKDKEGLRFITDVIFKWGYVVLFCVGLYLQKSFASREEVQQLRSAVDLLIERQKHDETQDRLLGELDQRVRNLEFKRVAGESRYNQAYPEK